MRGPRAMAWLSSMFTESKKDGKLGEPPSPAVGGAAPAAAPVVASAYPDDAETAGLKARVAALEKQLEEEKGKTERAARDKRQLEKALRQLLSLAAGEDEKKSDRPRGRNNEEEKKAEPAPVAAAPDAAAVAKANEERACREALRAATTKAKMTAAVERCEKAGLKDEAAVGRRKLGKM